MAENSFLIVIGAACGLLAAFFVYVAGRLWLQTVPPLFRRWWYRGVRISGPWKGLGASHAPESGEWSEVALSLKQNGRDLRGLMTIRSQSAGHSFDLDLQAAGRIAQGYATLSLSPVGKATSPLATTLLKIEGDALNGQLLYRDPFADKVDVINLSVHRVESVATPRLHPASRTAAGLPVLQAATPLAAAVASD